MNSQQCNVCDGTGKITVAKHNEFMGNVNQIKELPPDAFTFCFNCHGEGVVIWGAKAQDDSARLNEAIKQALQPHASKSISHELLIEAKESIGNVEAQMRSGSFGQFFLDHDIVIGYDTFGTLTWRLTGKF